MGTRKLCVAILAVLLSWLLQDIHAQDAEKKRFVPEEHLPGEMLVYCSVGNVKRLKDGLGRTLLGRIVRHRGSQRAVAGFLDLISRHLEESWQPFVQLTGKTPLELVALIEGEVVFGLRTISPVGLPEAVFAIELGAKGDELLAVVARLGRAAEEASGPLGTRKFGDHEATVWPLPWGPLFHTVLGNHLVLVSSAELLETVVSAYEGSVGGNSRTSLNRSPVHTELEEALPVRAPEVVLEVDVPRLRTFFLSALSMSPIRKDLQGIMAVSGLDRVSSLGFACGFRDGGVDAAWHLGTRGGARGVLKAIQTGFPAISDVDAALAKTPATASEFSGLRVNVGQILRSIDSLVRKEFPRLSENLDGLYGRVEAEFGISIKEDCFPLGDTTFYGFSVDPPAGGLFPDSLLLVKSQEFAGYWTLLKKMARSIEGKLRRLKWRSGELEYLDFPSALEESESFLDVFTGDGGLQPMALAALLPLLGEAFVARSDLPDGWTVVATAPQAVRRYVDHYARGPHMADAGKLTPLARTRISGASVATVAQGGSFLRAYNTIVSFSTRFLGYVLRPVGFDVAQLPPGEIFLKRAKAGFLRLTLAPDGFTLHGYRALESRNTLLVITEAAEVVASTLLPAISSGREEAYKVQCASNLKNLYIFTMIYADQTDRYFPHSPEGSLASLQRVVDRFPDDFRPEHFVCPDGPETAAALINGKLALTPGSCSYEIVPWRLKHTTPDAILLYEKVPHHGGGRHVILTDGAVLFIDEDTFQRRIETERKRFSRGEKEKRTNGR